MSGQRPPPGGQTDGLSLQKYGRFWAVYDQGALVVVTVYKKGALEVIQPLSPLQSHQTGEEGSEHGPQT
jgi:hypothetical protein